MAPGIRKGIKALRRASCSLSAKDIEWGEEGLGPVFVASFTPTLAFNARTAAMDSASIGKIGPVKGPPTKGSTGRVVGRLISPAEADAARR